MSTAKWLWCGLACAATLTGVAVVMRCRSMPTRKRNVLKIVLTGGPCSGKTSCTAVLRDSLTAIGVKVLVVPETATLLMSGGLDFRCHTQEKRFAQQLTVLRVMLALEDAFSQMSTFVDGPCVILCDRGAFDGSAYCPPDQWRSILTNVGVTEAELRARYDAVVHLVSLAVDAPEKYNQHTNVVRREGPKEAADLDALVERAWNLHRNVKKIQNHGFNSFEAKISTVHDFIVSQL